MKSVPNSLRTWFAIHFLVDILFALPLLFYPVWFLNLFGFTITETLTARLVGAALIGIGGTSLLLNKKGLETYNALLSLKIIWSISAIIGIILTILESSQKSLYLFLLIFILFSSIWVYYKIRIKF